MKTDIFNTMEESSQRSDAYEMGKVNDIPRGGREGKVGSYKVHCEQ